MVMPDDLRISLPCATLVPSNRTTRGTGSATYVRVCACVYVCVCVRVRVRVCMCKCVYFVVGNGSHKKSVKPYNV